MLKMDISLKQIKKLITFDNGLLEGFCGHFWMFQFFYDFKSKIQLSMKFSFSMV